MMNQKSEKQWQAESDANVLAEAEAVKSTGTRMRAARGAAKKLATEAEKKAKGMRKVAGGRRPGSMRY